MGSWSKRQLLSDFTLSLMWVWSGVAIKIFVSTFLGISVNDASYEILKSALYIANIFLFSFLTALLGGAYNPLTVLAGAISGDFDNFLYTVGARIPAQQVSRSEKDEELGLKSTNRVKSKLHKIHTALRLCLYECREETTMEVFILTPLLKVLKIGKVTQELCVGLEMPVH